jgi:chemotaxis signal transduction protein
MDHPILTFAARDEWYGVRVLEVREVAELRGVRAVPRAPLLVAGVAEVHGRVVTLIDLDRLVREAGPAAADDGAGPWYGVVLAPPYDHLGLLVRSRLDVANAPEAETIVPGRDGLVLTRVPLGERLLNLIALPALVDRVETAIRKGFRPGGDAGPGEE